MPPQSYIRIGVYTKTGFPKFGSSLSGLGADLFQKIHPVSGLTYHCYGPVIARSSPRTLDDRGDERAITAEVLYILKYTSGYN